MKISHVRTYLWFVTLNLSHSIISDRMMMRAWQPLGRTWEWILDINTIKFVLRWWYLETWPTESRIIVISIPILCLPFWFVSPVYCLCALFVRGHSRFVMKISEQTSRHFNGHFGSVYLILVQFELFSRWFYEVTKPFGHISDWPHSQSNHSIFVLCNQWQWQVALVIL